MMGVETATALRRSLLLAVLSRALESRQLQRGVDERNVGARLRAVAHQTPRAAIVLLRDQPDGVGEPDQPLEESAGLFAAALQDVVVGQPERAGEEGPLARRQPIDTGAGLVAVDEASPQQALRDGGDGAAHARILRRKEAH